MRLGPLSQNEKLSPNVTGKKNKKTYFETRFNEVGNDSKKNMECFI